MDNRLWRGGEVTIITMITSFTDIVAWKEAHALALLIYRVTGTFPKSELYSLTSQLRRAAVSVTSNIAEGYGRSTKNDREHFYTMASGSLYELKSQLILARDLEYLTSQQFKTIAEQANRAHKLLNGLLKAHRSTAKAA